MSWPAFELNGALTLPTTLRADIIGMNLVQGVLHYRCAAPPVLRGHVGARAEAQEPRHERLLPVARRDNPDAVFRTNHGFDPQSVAHYQWNGTGADCLRSAGRRNCSFGSRWSRTADIRTRVRTDGDGGWWWDELPFKGPQLESFGVPFGAQKKGVPKRWSSFPRPRLPASPTSTTRNEPPHRHAAPRGAWAESLGAPCGGAGPPDPHLLGGDMIGTLGR